MKAPSGSEVAKTEHYHGLRAFLGFENYYSGYVRDYAGIVSPMMELLKVERLEGKNGSTTKVKCTAEAHLAFVANE